MPFLFQCCASTVSLKWIYIYIYPGEEKEPAKKTEAGKQ